MPFQCTLKNKIDFTGIGLHSGAPVSMTLRPAAAGTGIVFHRVDLSPSVSIEAVAKNVVNTRLSTTIGRNGATVSTIEHLMAALAAFRIDNLHIDISGPEVPIMDGSAAPFAAAIRATGTRELSLSRKYIVVKKQVSVVEGDKKITIVPSRFFRISFLMNFDHPALGRQFRSLNFDREDFVTEYSAARTFGFLHEVETLKKNGLARGGSLENAVVIGEAGILNEEGLRYQDEFVRHKILDSVGDLYLAGNPIIGHVRATKSGHDLNHKLVTELLSRRDCWKLVDAEAAEPAAASAFDFALPELAWSEA